MCDNVTGVAVGSVGAMFLAAFLSSSIGTVNPTEYGILFNRVTGSVYDKYPKGPGLYFITPFLGFYYFPAYNRTLELSSARKAHGPPVDCRTGPDENDPDSGGQPVTLHISFVYRIRKEDIHKVYQSFALHYEQRLLMFARQAISDITQHFDPQLFWQDRSRVSIELTNALRREILKDGFVHVHSLQLLRAEFSPKYEATIIGIQLATQSRTTSQYRQQVVRVLKEIDILSAESTATITKIGADAEATATILMNNATMEGFTQVQDAKATGYRMFYSKLGWTQAQILKYIQMKTIGHHDPHKSMFGIQSGK
mmetsp:Transcript_4125/g.6070  ORF Transcript_4125/g.6070 Transcript_4125/m.6070 type:complete len:311 (+) Transcript_4125:2271-3203(+)